VARHTTTIGRGLLAACFALAACAGGMHQRVDVDSEDPGVETGSKDLRAVADKMVRSLVGLPELDGRAAPPRVAILRVDNRTKELLDTRLFTTKMRTQLVMHARGRIRFVDRSDIASAAIGAERDAKRAGEVSAAAVKQLAGVDYFLTGELASIDRTRGDRRSNYTRYAFRLVDAESSDIVWEDEYEVKKVAVQGAWDR
jgi:hypothetical protein